MKKIYFIILVVTMVFSGNLFAQEKVKVGGFASTNFQLNSTNGDVTSNTFRIRRARLSVSGDLNNIVSYKLQGDFYSSPSLVDAYMKIKINEAFAIQVGQYKIPFTLEGAIAPLDLEAIEYGNVISKLAGYSDISGIGKMGRDIGVMFSGSFIDMDGFNLLSYNVGIFNGNGPNIVDNNKAKDLVGKLEVRPIRYLTLEGSFHKGNYYVDPYNNGDRIRYNAGAQYYDGNLMLRSEYVWGQTGYLDALNNEYDLNSKGMYAVAGYWFKFNDQKLMPVIRFDSFTSDADDESTRMNYYTLGFTYLPYSSVQLKANYTLAQDNLDITDYMSNQFTLQLSFKF